MFADTLTIGTLRRCSPLVLAGFLLAACGRSTSLSECIVASTPASDHTRGAGAVVMMVPASSGFESEWQALLQGFRREYRAALDAYDEADRRDRAARIEEQTALKAQREAAKALPTERYSVYEDAGSGGRVWTNQRPSPAVWAAAHARSDASQKLADAARRVNLVVELHVGRAVETVKKHHTRLARADSAGCYTLTGVPVQRVYVLANYGDRYWFRAVDVDLFSPRLDFTPERSGWPFADARRVG